MRVYADNAATTQMSRVAIDAMLPYFDKVYGNPSSLHCVGVEGNALFLTHSADLGDGQDGTNLVIGIHDGHKAGVLANGITNLLGSDVVAIGNIQISDLEAFLFQCFQRMKHCMVLNLRGDDVLAFILMGVCRKYKDTK